MNHFKRNTMTNKKEKFMKNKYTNTFTAITAKEVYKVTYEIYENHVSFSDYMYIDADYVYEMLTVHKCGFRNTLAAIIAHYMYQTFGWTHSTIVASKYVTVLRWTKTYTLSEDVVNE